MAAGMAKALRLGRRAFACSAKSWWSGAALTRADHEGPAPASRPDQPVPGQVGLVWDNLNTHVSRAMAELIAARDWLTVFQFPPGSGGMTCSGVRDDPTSAVSGGVGPAGGVRGAV
jgi:hypothetical protein